MRCHFPVTFPGLLAIAILAFASNAALAAPRTVAEIALYEGADRQAVLEAGAKKEGTVLIYTTGTQTQPVFDAFAKKYPFLRVEVFRGDTSDITRRVMEEYKAAKHVVDSIDLNTGGLHLMRDSGHLQPYYSPELAKIKPEAIEPKKHWAFVYESYVSMGYNTKAVSEAEAPKTLDDLLDPKWKGKMAVPGTTTLPNWVGAVVMERGEQFLSRFVDQQIRVYEVSGRAVANLVVSGEIPLSPAIFNSHMANSRDEGASVAWRALGGVYSSVGAIAVASKAPHPHAAMLYSDFALGREGQIMRQKLGYATARTDLENPGKPEKIYYLSERPNYIAEYEAYSALARKLFGKGDKLPTNK